MEYVWSSKDVHIVIDDRDPPRSVDVPYMFFVEDEELWNQAVVLYECDFGAQHPKEVESLMEEIKATCKPAWEIPYGAYYITLCKYIGEEDGKRD